jgi:RNase adaptor protein for sRNA GlmZ degradation
MKMRNLLNETTPRVTDHMIAKYVEECMDKIEIAAGGNPDKFNSIKLAEAIVDYLQKKHIRYKDAAIKHGGYEE